jgi:hypothetical protein
MPVVTINVGPKRVCLTAYCPDDLVGALACEFVLGRCLEMLSGTTEEDMRRWLVWKQPDLAGLFAKLDAGMPLSFDNSLTIDPTNADAEYRIVKYLMRERMAQCAGRSFDPELGPILEKR